MPSFVLLNQNTTLFYFHTVTKVTLHSGWNGCKLTNPHNVSPTKQAILCTRTACRIKSPSEYLNMVMIFYLKATQRKLSIFTVRLLWANSILDSYYIKGQIHLHLTAIVCLTVHRILWAEMSYCPRNTTMFSKE